MRVLVVEDERVLADAIAEWLRREAFPRPGGGLVVTVSLPA